METRALGVGIVMSTADVPIDDTRPPPPDVPRCVTQWISWVALAMMTTSLVASLRAAPTMAVYGLACVFPYLLPAVVFLLPTSLVSAELASGWGGRHLQLGVGGHLQADGLPRGLAPVRDDDLLYYLSLLGFVASTLAYVFNPELASSGVWTAA